MNNPLGGLGPFASTAHKVQEIINLEKATPEEIRQWTLIGIVDLSARIAHLEKTLEKLEQRPARLETMTLVAGSLAWMALLVAVAALVRGL